MILTVTLNPAIDKILILDQFYIHKLHRISEQEISMVSPGGKGVNISITLKMLGEEVVASGFAGGHSGHLLCDALREKKITTNFIFSNGNTRTNISILDLKNETLTEINDPGQEIDEEDIHFFLENYKYLMIRAKMVVLAGSLPVGVPENIYQKMVQIARESGKNVILHTAPKYLNNLNNISPFMINPDMRSHHELFGEIVDGIENFIAVGKRIINGNSGTEIVVFTHRIENVVVVTQTKSYILRPRQMKIVNMLGYADTWLAAFVHAYLKNWPFEDVLKFASAAGLACIETVYKEIGSVKAIESNLNRIDLEEIV